MAEVDIRGALNRLAAVADVDPGPALLSAMQPVKGKAVQFTPVDTGALAASVDLSLDPSGVVVRLSFSERGGRIQKRLAIEYGNRFVRAQMPLQRALQGSEAAVRTRFVVLYRRAVRRLTRIQTVRGQPVKPPTVYRTRGVVARG